MSVKELRRDVGLIANIWRRRPFNVLIQVSNRCNMRCSFCQFWSNGVHPDRELGLDDFVSLEAQLAEMGRFIISIEGGEPLIRPDIIDIVRVFSARHSTLLYTNGWYITPEKAASLFAAGVAQVGVSIDFPDAQRHDAKRGLEGAWSRAWSAVELLRDSAPHGAKQVHVMTVFMEETRRGLEALLEQSASRGVGHHITLLATEGTRRDAAGGQWPSAPVAEELLRLWRAYPHFRSFEDYLRLMDPFLEKSAMPTCRAGAQSFNIDHLGNVAPCIEKIGAPFGNFRDEPLAEIHKRMVAAEPAGACQECWTLCRGMGQLLGEGGSWRAWRDFSTRMRAT